MKCRAIDDGGRADMLEVGTDGGRIEKVEFGMRGGRKRKVAASRLFDECGAQLTAGADEDDHLCSFHASGKAPWRSQESQRV